MMPPDAAVTTSIVFPEGVLGSVRAPKVVGVGEGVGGGEVGEVLGGGVVRFGAGVGVDEVGGADNCWSGDDVGDGGGGGVSGGDPPPAPPFEVPGVGGAGPPGWSKPS